MTNRNRHVPPRPPSLTPSGESQAPPSSSQAPAIPTAETLQRAPLTGLAGGPSLPAPEGQEAASSPTTAPAAAVERHPDLGENWRPPLDIHTLMPPTMAVPPDQPVMNDLMMQLINSQRQAGQKFYLVVLPEDDYARVEEFEKVDTLIARIRELLGKECHLFPFLGHRLVITKGPMRFLKTPFGSMLPLFEVPAPDQVEEEDHGWVGTDLHKPEIPQTQTEVLPEDNEPVVDPNAAAPTSVMDTPVFES